MTDKRRSENFSGEERFGLIEMVKKRIDEIEEKKNDTIANKKKKSAWSAVAEDMAANFPEAPKRKVKDWKELWRRMKTKAKSAARAKKADIIQTGGGKQVVGELDEEHLAVLNLIIGELEQFHCKWDDDSGLCEKPGDSPKSLDEQGNNCPSPR